MVHAGNKRVCFLHFDKFLKTEDETILDVCIFHKKNARETAC